MKHFILGILLISVGGSFSQARQQRAVLDGVVLDKRTKNPLELVNVRIEGTTSGAATNAQGHYRIQDVPTGIYSVKFSIIGYKEKVISEVRIKSGDNSLSILMEETTLDLDEIVVTPKPERYDASGVTARLNRQMIVSTPGSAQDIFWIVQTLPGIASDGDNSKLYVRGGSPDENLVLYDGATIRNPFHFDMMGGGYWSIFNSRLVEKVEFFAGGFPARYGDRLSSVLLIENRSAGDVRMKGEASISMSDVSGTFETPLPFAAGAALISVRRSYFDAFLKFTDLAAEYSVLPYFFDINSKLDFALSARHRLTVSGLYTRERMDGDFDRPNYQGNFAWQNKSGVASARLRSLFSDFFLSDFIASWTRTNNSTDLIRNAREAYEIQELTIKQDFTLILPSRELHLGGWIVWENDDVTINLPLDVAVSLGVGERQLRGSGESLKPSLYLDDKWTIGPGFIASLGLRYDYIAKSGKSTISPRLNVSYAWNEHMSLSADYGRYYQSPRPYELDINHNLNSKRAESFGIGLKHEVGEEIVMSLELYNKQISNLVTIDSTWNFASDGYGFARGAEFYVQLKGVSGFFGWLSYTYSISKRKEGRSPDLHWSDYDRPHLISLVANYRFDEQWQAGVRFRYGSGKPYTPVTSAWFDPEEGRWVPILGVHNSDRYKIYHRMDVRITRQVRFESFDLDMYLEVLNAYNRRNVVHYEWSESYSSRNEMTFLPLLPVLGVSARF